MPYSGINEVLTILGLNEKEIEVYKASFVLGTATVSQIAKKAEIKRANTYNLLKNIRHTGLVATFTEGKKTYYRALGVKGIENCIERQVQVLSQKQNELATVSRELEQLKEHIHLESPHLVLFEGKRAALQVWLDMLRIPEGETIYDIEGSHHIYGKPDDQEHFIGEDDFVRFARKRIEKRINIKFISTTHHEKEQEFQTQNLTKFTDAIYIPPAEWPYPVEFGSYMNKVYMVTYDKNPIGVIVENKLIAESFKILFEKFRAWAITLPNAKHVVVN